MATTAEVEQARTAPRQTAAACQVCLAKAVRGAAMDLTVGWINLVKRAPRFGRPCALKVDPWDKSFWWRYLIVIPNKKVPKITGASRQASLKIKN